MRLGDIVLYDSLLKHIACGCRAVGRKVIDAVRMYWRSFVSWNIREYSVSG